MDVFKDFMWDFFGSPQGDAFMETWKDLCEISIHLDTFIAGSWADEESLEKAKRSAIQQAEKFQTDVNRLERLQKELIAIGSSVKKHFIEWKVLEQTTFMRSYILKHLLASNEIKTDHGWNIELIKKLDESCLLALNWIENNWDRNRYADDPNKNGIYVPTDHILYRFKQMHEFHRNLHENKKE